MHIYGEFEVSVDLHSTNYRFYLDDFQFKIGVYLFVGAVAENCSCRNQQKR